CRFYPLGENRRFERVAENLPVVYYGYFGGGLQHSTVAVCVAIRSSTADHGSGGGGGNGRGGHKYSVGGPQ
ncbi:hypothetical protein TYRP_007326, partial [Tyrophagus putrescentiae]